MKLNTPNYIENYIPEFVYGASDGLITTMAIVAGSAGANLPTPVIIILGLANIFADGFSMGISSYLSAMAEQELGRKTHDPLIIAAVTMLSFIIMGLIPLSTFIYAHNMHKHGKSTYIIAYILTALSFFFIGGLKSRFTNESFIRSGTRTLVVGGLGTIIAYSIGYTLRNLK